MDCRIAYFEPCNNNVYLKSGMETFFGGYCTLKCKTTVKPSQHAEAIKLTDLNGHLVPTDAVLETNPTLDYLSIFVV